MTYSAWLYEWYKNEILESPLERSVELKKKKHKNFKDQVVKETQWLDSLLPKSTKIRIGLRIKCVLDGITEMPPCRVCGSPVSGIRKGEFNSTCGRKECRDEILTSSCIQYQEENGHPMHNEEIKKRARNSLKEFFNSDDYLDNREWYISRKKRDAIPKERFDYNGQMLIGDEEWYAFHPETLSNRAKNIISRIRNGQIKRKTLNWDRKIRMIKRKEEFGNWPNQKGVYSEEQIEFLNDKDKVKNLYEKSGSKKEAAKIIGITSRGITSALRFHNIPALKRHRSSSYEKRLSEILRSKGIEHEMNTRNQIGKEIDIYIPSLRLAVEINGLWYHSMHVHKGKMRHQEKALMCLDNGISFYAIWECDVLGTEKGYFDLLEFIERRKSLMLPDGSISLGGIWIDDFSPTFSVSHPQRHMVYRKNNTMSMIKVTESMDVPKEKEVYDYGSIKKPLI